MRIQGTPGEPPPAGSCPADYAAAAAEAVRGLNHVTIGGAGYEVPSDVYRLLGSLATMLARLPQVLGQASGWLGREDAAGRVGHDQLSDPAAVTAEVAVLRDDLAEAQR